MGLTVKKAATLAANIVKCGLEESGRIGKEVQSYKEIILEGVYGFRLGGYTAQTDSCPFNEGETVTIVVDGVAYTEVAKSHIFREEDFEMPIVYIGNPAPIGLDDNGAPYMVYGMSVESDGVVQHGVSVIVMSEYPQTNTSEHSLHIYKPETIHPIDQKYLPGVCLPVLELSEETCLAIMADSSGAGVQVTASEEAFFREVLAENVPCVVKASLSGVGALVGTYNVACDPNLKPLLFSNLFLFTALVAFGDNGVVFSLSRNT